MKLNLSEKSITQLDVGDVAVCEKTAYYIAYCKDEEFPYNFIDLSTNEVALRYSSIDFSVGDKVSTHVVIKRIIKKDNLELSYKE